MMMTKLLDLFFQRSNVEQCVSLRDQPIVLESLRKPFGWCPSMAISPACPWSRSVAYTSVVNLTKVVRGNATGPNLSPSS